MLRPKDKGTRAESAIVNWLRDELGVEVLRRSQQGQSDRGDIRVEGVPLMLESKATKLPSIPRWRAEVERQCLNASAEFGALLWSAPGLGPKSIDRWLAFEWAPTAMTGFLVSSGTTFKGPARLLARAVAHADVFDSPIYLTAEGKPVTTLAEMAEGCRVRLAYRWLADLQEYVAASALRLT